MNKVLTVIVPTYNMEKYLRRCLDSLIIDEEGMKQLEVLVINDGSKDSSSQIAHEYQDKYPDTYRVIDKENGNYGSCINRGLKEATGKYVKILDADDWFDNNNLQKFLFVLAALDVDLILTDYCIVKENNNKSIVHSYKSQNIIPSSSSNIEDLFLQNPTFYGSMHGFTYKHNLLTDMNYRQTEGISYTDQEWVDIPMTEVKTYYYAPLLVYHYLMGRDGQTMDNNTLGKSICQLMKVVLNVSEFVENGIYRRDIYSNYLLSQLKRQIEFIYWSCLYQQLFPIELLAEFDMNLMKYNHLYSIASSLNYKSIKYVVGWRGRRYKQITFICRLVFRLKKYKNEFLK